MGTLKTTNIQSISGSGTVTLGTSGETFAVGSGVTTTINRPAFQAVANSSQSISNTTDTKLTFGTENYDTDSAFASDKFTVPAGQGGKYLFQVTAALAGTLDAGHNLRTSFYKNGSAVTRTLARWYVSGTNQDAFSMSILIDDLSVGDYIEAYIYQNSGGTAGLTQNEVSISGYKLGA